MKNESALILDSSASRTVRNQHLLFKTYFASTGAFLHTQATISPSSQLLLTFHHLQAEVIASQCGLGIDKHSHFCSPVTFWASLAH